MLKFTTLLLFLLSVSWPCEATWEKSLRGLGYHKKKNKKTKTPSSAPSLTPTLPKRDSQKPGANDTPSPTPDNNGGGITLPLVESAQPTPAVVPATPSPTSCICDDGHRGRRGNRGGRGGRNGNGRGNQGDNSGNNGNNGADDGENSGGRKNDGGGGARYNKEPSEEDEGDANVDDCICDDEYTSPPTAMPTSIPIFAPTTPEDGDHIDEGDTTPCPTPAKVDEVDKPSGETSQPTPAVVSATPSPTPCICDDGSSGSTNDDYGGGAAYDKEPSYAVKKDDGTKFGCICNEKDPHLDPGSTATPTSVPTSAPAVTTTTAVPFSAPTNFPSALPLVAPTAAPTFSPTEPPTAAPYLAPITSPSSSPTASPSTVPTEVPSEQPTSLPSAAPTALPVPTPTQSPTPVPSASPIPAPSLSPIPAPTESPVLAPTQVPISAPTSAGTGEIVGKGDTPSPTPSKHNDSEIISETPSPTPECCLCNGNNDGGDAGTNDDYSWGNGDTSWGGGESSDAPAPETGPNGCACCARSRPGLLSPTNSPSSSPTSSPTAVPSALPTISPTSAPTASPTSSPTAVPSALPTISPTPTPTASPTYSPTAVPSALPTTSPTESPTSVPSAFPTMLPTASPVVVSTPCEECPVCELCPAEVVDDSLWSEVSAVENTCRWVAKKPYKRCKVEGVVRSIDSVGGEIIAELPAWEACPEACYHYNRNN